MNLSPIVLFVYNRPNHTERTLRFLEKNFLAKDSILYVFSDGPKSEQDVKLVDEVRSIVRNAKSFKRIEVEKEPINKGLSSSVIGALDKLFRKHESLIILEDDILTSPYFLKFMNDSLNIYQNDSRVAGVSGYCYPNQGIDQETFFLPIGCSWGWGTWSRAWNIFNSDSDSLLDQIKLASRKEDFDFGNYPFYEMLNDQSKAKIDSWAIRFYGSFFLKKMLFLYPKQTLTFNIGFDDSGTHSTAGDNHFNSDLLSNSINVKSQEVNVHPRIEESIKSMFVPKVGLIRKLLRKIHKLIR